MPTQLGELAHSYLVIVTAPATRSQLKLHAQVQLHSAVLEVSNSIIDLTLSKYMTF